MRIVYSHAAAWVARTVFLTLVTLTGRNPSGQHALPEAKEVD